MLMPLLTPASGKINFQLPEGAVLVSGDLIARLELDDCNAVTAAQPYPGGFPELGPPLVHSQGVDYRFKEAYSAAKMILEGQLPYPMLRCRADMLLVGRPQQHAGCCMHLPEGMLHLVPGHPVEQALLTAHLHSA